MIVMAALQLATIALVAWIAYKQRGIAMATQDFTAAMARLSANVEGNTSTTASAVALLRGLADQLRTAAGDPAAVNALADKIAADSTALADAIVANTPAA